MIIDTHSHLNFKVYDSDREEVIKRTKEGGVFCIDVGTKYETSKNAVELAEKNDGICAAIGMHPIHIKTDLMKLKMDEDEGGFAPLGEEYNKEKYKKLALSSKRVVAIGEIGLDYYYKPKGTAKKEQFKEKQKQVFIEQLNLAQELNLPVIIHCRMAFDDLYDILKTHSAGSGQAKKIRGAIHCFTGTLEEAQKFVDLGFYLGINGIIFSAQNGLVPDWKLDLNEAIRNIPLEKILVETDCPYLTPPASLREQAHLRSVAGGSTLDRNEPIFVRYIVQRIADLKGLSFDEVAEKTTENAQKLFNI